MHPTVEYSYNVGILDLRPYFKCLIYLYPMPENTKIYLCSEGNAFIKNFMKNLKKYLQNVCRYDNIIVPNNTRVLEHRKRVITMKRFTELTKAKETINNYTTNQVDFVRKCRKECLNLISDFFINEGGYVDEKNIGHELRECRNDYLLEAYLNDIMIEEDFFKIYNALEVIATYHEAQAVC